MISHPNVHSRGFLVTGRYWVSVTLSVIVFFLSSPTNYVTSSMWRLRVKCYVEAIFARKALDYLIKSLHSAPQPFC